VEIIAHLDPGSPEEKKTFLWKALLVLEALWRKHSVFCKKMNETKFEQK